MNRNKLLLISIAGASLLAITASQMVWSKAHVPLHKVQMCHKGEVIQVGAPALSAHLRHGDVQLPACDFANVFQTGQPCDGTIPNTPNPAGGVTPACPVGKF